MRPTLPALFVALVACQEPAVLKCPDPPKCPESRTVDLYKGTERNPAKLLVRISADTHAVFQCSQIASALCAKFGATDKAYVCFDGAISQVTTC